jgi:signal transduction histidine kinase
MVNHELRNALAAVYGWSELLVRKKDPATVPRAAFEVLESAEQAVGLINDLLDLSRLDENRLKPNILLVESGGLAKRAVGRATPAAVAKEIRLLLEIPTGLPPIETDASRVEQILVNLLTNAIKYTPERSVILVSVRSTDTHVIYQVDDEGPGIAETEAERIFDIYVTKADGDKQGIGLGLPLSRRLARLLGGELRATPKSGAGIFSLELPIRRKS